MEPRPIGRESCCFSALVASGAGAEEGSPTVRLLETSSLVPDVRARFLGGAASSLDGCRAPYVRNGRLMGRCCVNSDVSVRESGRV